jgi:NADP-dependent 3-hydroxy acid dehydrogenase YdfG
MAALALRCGSACLSYRYRLTLYLRCNGFVAKGFIVYATARSVAAMSDLTHKNVRKLVVDVTNDVSVANGIKQVYTETEGIDVLVSNAGYSHIGEVSQKVLLSY